MGPEGTESNTPQGGDGDAGNGGNNNAGDGNNNDRSFTQDEVNQIIAQRLDRQRSQFSNYDEFKKSHERLQEIENAAKSENEVLTETNQSLATENGTLKSQLLRYEVGLSKNVPPSLIPRLRGETKEEMEQDAETLLKEINGGNPGPDFGGGPRGDAPKQSGMDAFIRAAAGR